MAKKNAREEPPKPQVTENEQMSDIVFILDKMELILEAVKTVTGKSKFNTVAADRQNRNSFLKIDRYADAFENFIKNFWSQLKDPTRFGILSVKEDRLDDPAVQQAIEDLYPRLGDYRHGLYRPHHDALPGQARRTGEAGIHFRQSRGDIL